VGAISEASRKNEVSNGSQCLLQDNALTAVKMPAVCAGATKIWKRKMTASCIGKAIFAFFQASLVRRK